MTTLLRRAWSWAKRPPAGDGLKFDRPLVIVQSDDWGRTGVRDREGWDELVSAGLPLGESPYDFYSLETADDLAALRAVLRRHQDSAGRNPSIVMNFITANVDFARCLKSNGEVIPLVPLTDGLPETWKRPRLFEEYQQGIREGVFFPALHGLTHFCAKAVSRDLEADGERGRFVRKLWSAGASYIHWRMPWIGFEYWDAELRPDRRSLPLADQRSSITRAANIYRELFGAAPLSACAPGYRANADTRTAWLEAGVRVVQNGPGGRQSPYLDDRGMLHTFRTIEMEPAVAPCDLESVIRDAENCFQRGRPAVVSIHSINFHSTIRDFRTPTLALLDKFLSRLETRWPNLLYLNDADLLHIATDGCYIANGKNVSVNAIGASAKNE